MVRLNKEQRQAVNHKNGPLLIIAGAGTGKTSVVTERIKRLIFRQAANPSEILALTFTEKAAREMQERVDIGMPYGYTQMWIMTFHSFCDRVLRAEALHIGLDPKYTLLSQATATQTIRDNLFKFSLDYFRPLGNPTKFIGGMLQHFSRLQDEDISPSDYLLWVKKQKAKKKNKTKEDRFELAKWQELAGAYKSYDGLKTKRGWLDFGDLIIKTLKLFRDRPNVLKEYRQKFKYIMVDEFQDTNYAQNELAILLAGKKKNIAVTGDDDQSVYRFRGAAVSNIIQFRRHFSKAKVVTLTKNYRSNQEILDKAYNLIQHNNPDRLEVIENVDKKLVAARKGPASRKNSVQFLHLDRVENEAEAVAKEIGKLKAKENYDWKDFAILVRANNHAEPFTRALSQAGMPHQFLGPGRLFKQPEVVDLISYLRVLNNFEDSVAFYRVISQDHFDVSPRDIAKLGNYARRYHISLFEAAEKVDNVFVTSETKKKLKEIVGIVNRHLRLIKKETAGQILFYYLEETGLMQSILNPKNARVEKRAANVSKFFDKLKSYETDNENANVSAVVDWIELATQLGESPLAADTDWTDVNAVNILTVHSAKGLEFPVVFLVNLVSQRFPTVERREQIPIPDELIKEVLPQGDFHIQEERRLFYVGMTRARDHLFMTAANYYGEGKRDKKLSPFIFEALGEGVVSAEIKNKKIQSTSVLKYAALHKPDSTPRDSREFHVDFLSYSQIDTFSICPLHYKLKYILRVPTAPSGAQSFGTSMHNAFKEFYASAMSGKKVSTKLFEKIYKENWVGDGYSDKAHERERFKEGIGIIRNYYKNEFDPKKLPMAVEQPFVIQLKSKKAGERPLKIGGKIDRIDEFGKGGIEIIDYKTASKVPTQREVDNNLQLTFYALAATSIREAPFKRRPKDVVLSLYYFNDNEKMTTTRTKQDLQNAEREIFEWKAKIEKSDFKCSGHFFCQSCEYSSMCLS